MDLVEKNPKKNIERPSRKNFSKEIKEQVVLHIVKGEYFVEELMKMYDISSRDTIIRWLSDYVRKQKKQQRNLS